MNRSHELILKAIQQEKLTGREIAGKTGLSYDGIRGRISELRKMGYPIKIDGDRYYMNGTEKYTPFVIKKDDTGIILTLPIDAMSDVSVEQVDLFEKISKDFIIQVVFRNEGDDAFRFVPRLRQEIGSIFKQIHMQ